MNITILDDYQDTITIVNQVLASADGKPINVGNPEVLRA